MVSALVSIAVASIYWHNFCPKDVEAARGHFLQSRQNKRKKYKKRQEIDVETPEFPDHNKKIKITVSF